MYSFNSKRSSSICNSSLQNRVHCSAWSSFWYIVSILLTLFRGGRQYPTFFHSCSHKSRSCASSLRHAKAIFIARTALSTKQLPRKAISFLRLAGVSSSLVAISLHGSTNLESISKQLMNPSQECLAFFASLCSLSVDDIVIARAFAFSPSERVGYWHSIVILSFNRINWTVASKQGCEYDCVLPQRARRSHWENCDCSTSWKVDGNEYSGLAYVENCHALLTFNTVVL